MRCSHNMPFEVKCDACTAEALMKVRTLPQSPPPNATFEQITAFYQEAYRVAHPNENKPGSTINTKV